MSLVNTVLATITAAAFKEFADAIESGKAPADVARASLNESWKVTLSFIIKLLLVFFFKETISHNLFLYV